MHVESRTGDAVTRRAREYLTGGTVGEDLRTDLNTVRTSIRLFKEDLHNTASRLRKGKFRLSVKEVASTMAMSPGIVVYMAGAEGVALQQDCDDIPGATLIDASTTSMPKDALLCYEYANDGAEGNGRLMFALTDPLVSPAPESGISVASTPEPAPVQEDSPYVIPTIDFPEIPTINIPTVNIPTLAPFPTLEPLPTYAPLPTVDWGSYFDLSATSVPSSPISPIDWENTAINEYKEEIFFVSLAAIGLVALSGILLATITSEEARVKNSHGRSQAEPMPESQAHGRTPGNMRPSYDVPEGQPVRAQKNRRDDNSGEVGEEETRSAYKGLIYLGDNSSGEPIFGDGSGKRFGSDGRKLKGQKGVLFHEQIGDKERDDQLGF